MNAGTDEVIFPPPAESQTTEGEGDESAVSSAASSWAQNPIVLPEQWSEAMEAITGSLGEVEGRVS